MPTARCSKPDRTSSCCAGPGMSGWDCLHRWGSCGGSIASRANRICPCSICYAARCLGLRRSTSRCRWPRAFRRLWRDLPSCSPCATCISCTSCFLFLQEGCSRNSYAKGMSGDGCCSWCRFAPGWRLRSGSFSRRRRTSSGRMLPQRMTGCKPLCGFVSTLRSTPTLPWTRTPWHWPGKISMDFGRLRNAPGWPTA